MSTDRSVSRDRLRRGRNQINVHQRPGSLPRRKPELQITKGLTVGCWIVESTLPTRNIAGKLEWTMRCEAGHSIQADHQSLIYEIGVPVTCRECEKEDALRKAEEAKRFSEWQKARDAKERN